MGYSVDTVSGAVLRAIDQAAGIFPNAATPLTMACWMNAQDVVALTGSGGIMSINQGGTAARYFVLEQDSTALELPTCRIRAANGATIATAGVNFAGGDVGADVWFLIVGVFTSDSNRTIYLYDGTVVSANEATTSVTPPLIDSVTFGETTVGATSGGPMWVAEAAIWNRALTPGEITQLTTLTADQVAVANLQNYWPLETDTVDVISGVNLVAGGTSAPVGSHPPVTPAASGPTIDTVTASTPTDVTLPAGATTQITNGDGGTYWAGIWPQASRPTTHAQIVAGTGAVGAVQTGTIPGGGLVTLAEYTGLTKTTAYALYVTAEDSGLTPVPDGQAGFDDFATLAQAVVVQDTLIDVETGAAVPAGVTLNYWIWPDTDINPGPMSAPALQGTTLTVDPAGGFNFQIDVTGTFVDSDAVAILTQEDVPGGTPPQIDDNWGSGAIVVAVDALT